MVSIYNNNQSLAAGPLAPAALLERATRSVILRPSDLTFTWQECHRCTYDTIMLGARRPKPVIPAIFQAIDKEMKQYFWNARTEAAGVAADVPTGEFTAKDVWVTSQPLAVPGLQDLTVVIKGCIDTVITLDDGTLCLCDFKTSSPSAVTKAHYARQLNAYAVALKYAASPRPRLTGDVTRLGLLTFSPNCFKTRPHNHLQMANGALSRMRRSVPTSDSVRAYLGGSLTWTELPLDEAAFGSFVANMMRILTAPEPPAANADCRYCSDQARIAARRLNGGES